MTVFTFLCQASVTRLPSPRRWGGVVLLALTAACGNDVGPDVAAAHLTSLADPPSVVFPGDTAGLMRVRVTDADGHPVRGAAVRWAADHGGTLIPAASVSDDEGVAVAWWITGLETGRQVVSAALASGTAAPIDSTEVVGWQVAAVSSGRGYRACAIGVDGGVACWTYPASTPVRIDAPEPFTAIRTGGEFACALSASGRVWCWGDNTFGQLGNGGTAAAAAPTLISLPANVTVSGLFTGYQNACVIATDGTAWCWGSNASGELGHGDILPTLVPTPVSGGLTWKSLALEFLTSCGLDTDRRTWCWGETVLTPLQGTARSYLVPTAVPSAPALDTLVASDWNQCGLTGGALYCYPYINTDPVTLSNVKTLAAGYKPFFALATDGTAYSFGGIPNSTVGFGVPPLELSGGLSLAAVGNTDLGPCGIDASTSTVFCWGSFSFGAGYVDPPLAVPYPTAP